MFLASPRFTPYNLYMIEQKFLCRASLPLEAPCLPSLHGNQHHDRKCPAIGRIFQNSPPRPVLRVVGCVRSGPAVMFPDSTTCSGTLNADGCCLSSPGTTRCPAFFQLGAGLASYQKLQEPCLPSLHGNQHHGRICPQMAGYFQNSPRPPVRHSTMPLGTPHPSSLPILPHPCDIIQPILFVNVTQGERHGLGTPG